MGETCLVWVDCVRLHLWYHVQRRVMMQTKALENKSGEEQLREVGSF